MGKRFLIDTNILLEYASNILPANANFLIEDLTSIDFNISIINRIEVLGHPSATQDISDFLDLANQHELTKEIAKQAIALRKAHKIKLPDAIVVATAIVHNFSLISRNTNDFANIQGLHVLDPYTM